MTTAYGTTAGYKAWADARGVSYADKTDEQIDAARERASDYIDGAYRGQFPGVRTAGRDQTREWPRAGAYDREGLPVDSAGVPVEIETATYEGAKRELESPGSLAPDIAAGDPILKRRKVASIEREWDVNRSRNAAVFRAIDQALGSLIVVRASYSGASVRA